MSELSAFGCTRPILVIAELSGNHNGSLARAKELMHAAKESGADAVKLQTYTADTITIDAPGPWFDIADGPWKGRRLYELYQEASTPWQWHEELFAEAARLRLPCFSTPFDPTAVEFLERLSCPIYKVASFEVIDTPLLAKIAATHKPVIMSTGMASLAEIDAAVSILRSGGCPQLALLSCVSRYPADPVDMYLRNIPHLAAAFSCPTGLSDHSSGHAAACAAIALGGCIIEKHLTLRRADGGPDAGFSMEPEEFSAMAAAVHTVAMAMRNPVAYGVKTAEAGSIGFRKSLFVVHDVPADSILGPDDVRAIRPGHGLAPVHLPQVIGRRVRQAIVRGTPLSWELLS